ncbi:hypothetical protein MMC22_006306 [Lobaria immixta]|nr:hypothetical protein [Lobaria immixta]
MSGFLGLIRLHNDTAIITANSYNPNNGITTGIILQTDENEMKAIKKHILHNTSSIGHELLLRTILTEISLKVIMEHLSEVKEDVMDIEHNTGQHTWHNYRPKRLGPLSDVELSREAHGLRIQTAVVCRRIEVTSIWIELLLESFTKDRNDSVNRAWMLQWLRNMEIEVKMAKLDVDLIAKRAENQVGAIRKVYNRFAQRDNITTQKISEATNRESAAMKYLAVLGAIFFPGTYVAALFALDSLKGVPFWMYWVITTPLTFTVLGIWAFWIYWRSESVKKQERKLDGKAIA